MAILGIVWRDLAFCSVDKTPLAIVNLVDAIELRASSASANADALLLAGRIVAHQSQVGEARAFWKRSVDAAHYSAAAKVAQCLRINEAQVRALGVGGVCRGPLLASMPVVDLGRRSLTVFVCRA